MQDFVICPSLEDIAEGLGEDTLIGFAIICEKSSAFFVELELYIICDFSVFDRVCIIWGSGGAVLQLQNSFVQCKADSTVSDHLLGNFEGSRNLLYNFKARLAI